MVRRSVIQNIYKEIISIRQHLEDIEANFSRWSLKPLDLPESELVALPDHLRRTYVVVTSKGECNAIQVSCVTGRCRAVESNYLNQLSRMGWLEKRRISKTVHYRPVSELNLQETTVSARRSNLGLN